MEYKTDALGLKFIHWGTNKEIASEGISIIEPTMKMIFTNKPGTKVKNGLFFKHSVRIGNDKGLIIHCVAEEVFINDGIADFTFNEMKGLVQFAFDRFNSEYSKKSSEAGIPNSIDYTIKDDEILELLSKL